MTMVLALIALTAQGPLFNVTTIPVRGWNTWECHPDADGDGKADYCIVEGLTLSLRSKGTADLFATVVLAEGTQAFDIMDIDGDGRPEVIAICGRRVLRYAILPPEEQGGPVELFSLESPWPGEPGRPRPHVIVVEYGGETVLALPNKGTLEIRRVDGTVALRCPVHPLERVEGKTFQVSPSSPLKAGSPDALALTVGEEFEWEPELPPEFQTSEKEDDHTWLSGSVREARRAADKKPELWPWFPLKKEGDSRVRVLYALGENTLIRLRTEAEELPSRNGDGITIGGVHAYPGTIVPHWGWAKNLPDFNGDGYVDLVLWSAPQPGMSVDSLTRSAFKRTWPIRLTVHLFSPEKSRYEPRPTALIKFRVPIPWLLMHLGGTPFENPVFADFDEDGRSDCGLSTTEDSFSVWLYDDGFPSKPTETHEFPESIEHVAAGEGTARIRSEHYIHLLSARKESEGEKDD